MKITTRLPRWLLSLAVLALAVEATAAQGPAATANVDDARLLNAAKEPQNWLIYGGGWSEQHYSPLKAIDVTNVSRLKPAWSFDFDTYRGQEATPVVVDGVMYVSSAWSKVFALDAKTGKPLWSFDPKVPGPADLPLCCDVVNRGVAVYKGRVYVGTIDARLIALDAATGKVVWSVVTAPAGSTYSITGAPRVARNKVFIGSGGGEFGHRGYVSAYDTATGKLVWRFYVVPGGPADKPDGAASDSILAKLARPTWFGDWYKYGGGGHAWNALTFDSDLTQLYIATGNGFPWNREFRSAGKGDNLFISSIVALDADTGDYKWHYQETPGDQWDYDAVQNMSLADLDIRGKTRKVLLHAPKNGFFYVLDRKSGELLSAENYVAVNWATKIDLKSGRPVEAPGARYGTSPAVIAPGAAGAHNWHPMAFSPNTGLVYIPTTESSMPFRAPLEFRFGDQLFTNIGVDFGPAGGNTAHGAAAPPPLSPAAVKPSNFVLAWDPVAQKERWRADGRGGGILATAGNLVIQGRTRDGALGELVAFRADTGEKLWSHATPNGITAGPATYSVGGEQFIAVSSGAGSTSVSGTPTRMRHVGRVVAFRLDGTASFPPEAPPALPANPPTIVASGEEVASGEKHYNDYCARCHGFGAASGNVIPDLRRSLLLTSKLSWDEVVLNGALTERGMIGWSKFLNPAQVDQVRAYVGEMARGLQQQERK